MPLKPTYPLSPREAEVLAQLMLGKTNKQAAKALKSTEQTVKVQVKAILRKLQVTSRLEAVLLVLRAAIELPCPRCGYVDKRREESDE
jgi:Response regulator containing a CheY-like receiver domain and an HTH DNA-binding domain